jgi:hypothetical protein
MADWNKIKTEYITTNTSYRKLAQKYGVHYNAIANRAKQEDWISQRERYCDRTVTKTVTAISDKQVDRAARLQSVADRLLQKVERLMDIDDKMLEDSEGEASILGAKGMKSLSGILKDIGEIQGIKSDADMREQEARIEKLRREAEREDDTTNEIEIVFNAGPEEWNG